MASAKPKKVVRVHFVDNTLKAFAIEDDTTALQLRQAVIEKIELKEDACFALFERKDSWERVIDPEEKLMELIKVWDVEGKGEFLFKKKIFLRDDEKELSDPVAKHHVYIQFNYNVISSEYPCTIDEAIILAGLQMQITYDNHNPSTHLVGFLSNDLAKFIPKALMTTKKGPEWEQLILKQHATLTGKPVLRAKTDYINFVKQWPFYGTTFYPLCKTISRNVGQKKIPSKVILGVNADGILLLKKDKELFSTHPFTEICSWASSANTFAFEYGSESVKYVFETKLGAVIASTIQTYINILLDMLKADVDADDAGH